MVKIHRGTHGKDTKRHGFLLSQKLVTRFVAAMSLIYVVITLAYSLSLLEDGLKTDNIEYEKQLRHERLNHPHPPVVMLSQSGGKSKNDECMYQSINDLSIDELQPIANSRHMVTPPIGGKVSLVCCTSTAGPLTILAHHQWAPLGAEHFMEMVTTGYFNSTKSGNYPGAVPFMRCVKDWLCQFGLNSDPRKKELLTKGSIKDDPNWLPEGKEHRRNKLNVRRFAKGYLAYAGSGKDSRGNQLIVALKENGPLGGGSPWEVPWGEVVGSDSFATLDRIYTGYGENGPPQGRLMREGASDAVQKEWPKLDYITTCAVLEEKVLEKPLRDLRLED